MCGCVVESSVSSAHSNIIQKINVKHWLLETVAVVVELWIYTSCRRGQSTITLMSLGFIYSTVSHCEQIEKETHLSISLFLSFSLSFFFSLWKRLDPFSINPYTNYSIHTSTLAFYIYLHSSISLVASRIPFFLSNWQTVQLPLALLDVRGFSNCYAPMNKMPVQKKTNRVFIWKEDEPVNYYPTMSSISPFLWTVAISCIDQNIRLDLNLQLFLFLLNYLYPRNI